MTELTLFLMRFFEIAVFLLVFALGIIVFSLSVLYTIDKSQTTQAIRHNLRKIHARILRSDGKSVPLNQLYPEPN